LAALVVSHLLFSLVEGIAIGAGDDLDEARVVTAALALDVDVVGDDVGRLAGAEAVDTAEAADVRRTALAGLVDLAEPSAAVDVGQGQDRNHGGGNAFLGMDAGVSGAALDLDLPALGPDRADGELLRRLSVDVETHDGVAEVFQVDVACPPQSALLADRE